MSNSKSEVAGFNITSFGRIRFLNTFKEISEEMVPPLAKNPIATRDGELMNVRSSALKIHKW